MASFVGTHENLVRLSARLEKYRTMAPAEASAEFRSKFIAEGEYNVRLPTLQASPVYAAVYGGSDDGGDGGASGGGSGGEGGGGGVGVVAESKYGAGEDIASASKVNVDDMLDEIERITDACGDNGVIAAFRESQHYRTIMTAAEFCVRTATQFSGTVLVRMNCPGEKQTKHKLKEGKNSVGRDQNSTVQVPKADEDVSRAHCCIEMTPRKECFLSDSGSARGTTLNGVKIIGTSALQPGDVILVGKTTIEIG